MLQRAWLICPVMLLVASPVWAVHAKPEIARKIVKVPAFQQAQQQYFLLLLGQKPHREIWIIADGRDFYVDRNGNGDLTDAGEKFTAPKPERGPWLSLNLGNLRDAHGVEHGPVRVHLDGNTVSDISMPITNKFVQVARRPPAATTPASACVLHFDGPLSAGFIGNVKGVQGPTTDPRWATLSRSKKVQHQTWLGTQIEGSPPVYVRLAPDPKEEARKPHLRIVYEPRDPKEAPVTRTHLLFDCFEVQVDPAPANSGAKARISLIYPTLPELKPYEIEVEVRD